MTTRGRRKPGCTPFPVQVRNTVFQDANECAAHFNMKAHSVRRHIQLGRADFIGFGRGNKFKEEVLRREQQETRD